MRQTNSDGAILFASGGLVMAGVLPPSASVVLGAAGIAYVVLKPPPSGPSFWERLRFIDKNI